jgi:hypothetical protein
MIEMSRVNPGAGETLTRWIDMAEAVDVENLLAQVVAAGTVEGWGGTHVFGILSEIMNINIHMWDTQNGGTKKYSPPFPLHPYIIKNS